LVPFGGCAYDSDTCITGEASGIRGNGIESEIESGVDNDRRARREEEKREGINNIRSDNSTH